MRSRSSSPRRREGEGLFAEHQAGDAAHGPVKKALNQADAYVKALDIKAPIKELHPSRVKEPAAPKPRRVPFSKRARTAHAQTEEEITYPTGLLIVLYVEKQGHAVCEVIVNDASHCGGGLWRGSGRCPPQSPAPMPAA
jgi:hypothetical protein